MLLSTSAHGVNTAMSYPLMYDSRSPCARLLLPLKPEEIKPAFRKPRPRLAGTAHLVGWVLRKRTLRAHLNELVAAAPPDKAGSEQAALEVIDSIHLLNPRA